MGRLLARSSRAFMKGVLGLTGRDTQTSFASIRDFVAQDETEVDPVRKVLGVLVKQKHLTQTGDGDDATYQLTASGEQLLNDLGGA